MFLKYGRCYHQEGLYYFLGLKNLNARFMGEEYGFSARKPGRPEGEDKKLKKIANGQLPIHPEDTFFDIKQIDVNANEKDDSESGNDIEFNPFTKTKP